MKSLFIPIVAIALMGCAQSMLPSNHLAEASCPELTPLQDETFGATSAKLVEVAGIYYQCRTAVLGVDAAAK